MAGLPCWAQALGFLQHWSIGDMVQAVGVLAVVLLGLLLSRQLRLLRLGDAQTARQKEAAERLATEGTPERRRERTMEYALSRNPAVAAAQAAVDLAFPPHDWLNRRVPRETLLGAMAQDKALGGHLLLLMRHWDSLALAVEAGLVDEDLAFEMAGPTLVEHADRFECFLIRQREDGHLRQYVYLIRLAERWRRRLVELDNTTLFPAGAPLHQRKFP